MFFLLFSIRWVDSQEMVFPVTSCEGSEGKCCSRDSALAEGCCPGKGRPFSHVREGESDLFVIIVVDRLVDKEIELHSVQPVLRLFIGSIERFGGADA